ncbi:hypothetical protein TSAR_008644, partial [Trichomalopsis sarcophagae]
VCSSSRARLPNRPTSIYSAVRDTREKLPETKVCIRASRIKGHSSVEARELCRNDAKVLPKIKVELLRANGPGFGPLPATSPTSYRRSLTRRK